MIFLWRHEKRDPWSHPWAESPADCRSPPEHSVESELKQSLNLFYPVVLKEMSCLLWWPSFQWMNLNQWMVSGHVAQWPADDLNMDKQKRGTYTSPQRTALITSPHLSVIFACWFQSCNVWVTSENVTMAGFHDSCRTFYMNLHDDVSAEQIHEQ